MGIQMPKAGLTSVVSIRSRKKLISDEFSYLLVVEEWVELAKTAKAH